MASTAKIKEKKSEKKRLNNDWQRSLKRKSMEHYQQRQRAMTMDDVGGAVVAAEVRRSK